MNSPALLILLAAVTASDPAPRTRSPDPQAGRLVGLWQAKRRFGPDVRGTLVICQRQGNWQAQIAGYTAPVNMSSDSVAFELPDNLGAFRGRFISAPSLPGSRSAPPASRTLIGHWIQASLTE